MDKKEKRDIQLNELYKSYGRFAIEFEQMCFRIKTSITFSMIKNGLKEQRFINILLADQTAYPLIVKLRSIISLLYQDKPEVLEHLSPLFKFCLKINERRNEIIHASWFVGFGSHDNKELIVALGMKDKITAKGLNLNSLTYDYTNFDELTDKVIIANELIEILYGCIAYDLDIIKNIDSVLIKKLSTLVNKT